MDTQSLLSVKINFATSQNFFPHIIEGILAILLVVIFATRWRAIHAALSKGPLWPLGIDQYRFFGTVICTVIYFVAMPFIGYQFPNTGLGFLFASIPYVFLIGILYLHSPRPRQLVYAAINAVVAPTIVWYLLSNVFNISLP